MDSSEERGSVEYMKKRKLIGTKTQENIMKTSLL